MRIIIVLILISLLVALGFLLAFFWAMNSGQFDDSYTPSIRMLIEDEYALEEENDTVSKP